MGGSDTIMTLPALVAVMSAVIQPLLVCSTCLMDWHHLWTQDGWEEAGVAPELWWTAEWAQQIGAETKIGAEPVRGGRGQPVGWRGRTGGTHELWYGTRR